MASSWDLPLARAAKVEYSWCRWSCPQDGHSSPLAAPFRTSFSNLVPQSSHLYSKIGIAHSTSAKAILSTQARTSAAGAAKLFTRMENASRPLDLLPAYPESATDRASVPVLA